jgi:hypothetical protein
MSTLVRLATASLLVCAPIALASSPGYAAETVARAVQSTSLLPQPDLPLPEVSVPSLPLPEVSVPEPPAVPKVSDVPAVPKASPPAVSTPRLPSPPQPAPRPPQQDAKAGAPSHDGPAAAGRPASAKSTMIQGSNARTPNARPEIAQVDDAQAAPSFTGADDDYLLGLVHDELCAALFSLLQAMPETVVGLPPGVIAQLPPEVVNVVPEAVLARATLRCSGEEPAGAEDDGLLTRVLGLHHPHTGMLGAAAFPIGIGLLSLGLGLRVAAGSGAYAQRIPVSRS